MTGRAHQIALCFNAEAIYTSKISLSELSVAVKVLPKFLLLANLCGDLEGGAMVLVAPHDYSLILEDTRETLIVFYFYNVPMSFYVNTTHH